ncbi:MAG: regulatory protein RecX [Dehalococcoidia bacterium]|nr:regulatory protein RecX [Dehalococcoidia bacterium]MCB9485826.1 regulatory protein RecX [Thermoflexaceae bacterium]
MDEPPSKDLTIVEIVTGKRRMQLVRLSDGRDFVFSEEACVRAGLRAGLPVSEETLSALDAAEQRVQAHEAALRLLSHRSRSESEMRTRLTMRGIDPGVIEGEIERLRDSGLLDDEKFARAWVEDRKRLAPRGRRMLRYELLGRGIAPEAVDEVTADVDDGALALELARGRARRTKAEDYESFVTNVGGFLRRRGFSYDVVMSATKAAWEEAARDG